MLYQLLRPLLFQCDPETAHHLTLNSLKKLHHLGVANCLSSDVTATPKKVMDLNFPNPVGLAAGLDKDGAYIDALAALGFGFIEIGTVTPRPQPGNSKPRLFRILPAQALINRLGFNNAGIDQVIDNVKKSTYRGVLGINIGKNADTPIENASDDYLHCLRKAYPHASYITVNVSSPNTPNLRDLQQIQQLDKLLQKLKQEQTTLAEQYARYVPIAIKVAPDLASEHIKEMADLFLKHRVDAVIATNTTTNHDAVEKLPQGKEVGGVSGAPLFKHSTEVLREFHSLLQTTIPLIGVGGVMTGKDACDKIIAGASLVQIYTGLIYQGPELVSDIIKQVTHGSSNVETH